MKDEYCKLLTDLKPLLPPNYLLELDKRLPDIDYHKIVDAFRGKVSDENILMQIVTQAQFLAQKRENDLKRLKRKNEAIKSAVRKASGFFLPLLGNFLHKFF